MRGAAGMRFRAESEEAQRAVVSTAKLLVQVPQIDQVCAGQAQVA